MKKLIFFLLILSFPINSNANCIVKLHSPEMPRMWETTYCPVEGEDGCYRFFTYPAQFEINMCPGNQEVEIIPMTKKRESYQIKPME